MLGIRNEPSPTGAGLLKQPDKQETALVRGSDAGRPAKPSGIGNPDLGLESGNSMVLVRVIEEKDEDRA